MLPAIRSVLVGASVGLLLAPALAGGARADDPSAPILVGIASAQTSFMAQFDTPAAVGAEMAIEDINKAGGVLGRKLKWIYQDTKSDKGQAVIAAKNLIDQGAKVLLVSCDFDFGGPSASVAQDHNLIAFGCAGSPRFGRQGIGPDVFTMDTLTPDEGGTLAEWAYMKQGWKKAYVITDTTMDYTKTLVSYFETRFKQMAGPHGIVGHDTIQNSDPSFSAQLTRIRELHTKPDIILLATCAPALATALRQMRAAGVNTAVASGVCGDGDFWLPSAPKDLSNFYNAAYISTHFDDPRPEVNAFVKRLLVRAKNPPQRAFGVVGYSEIQAYAKAVEKAGSFDTDAVRQALESFKNVPLLIGPTTFTKDIHGDMWRPMSIIAVTDGKHHFLTRWTIQQPPPP